MFVYCSDAIMNRLKEFTAAILGEPAAKSNFEENVVLAAIFLPGGGGIFPNKAGFVCPDM